MSRGKTEIGGSGDAAIESTVAAMNDLISQGKSFSGRERHCAFLNTGELRFADVSAVTGLDYADDGRAIAQVDWDLDGDLDFWISNRNGPQVRFMRNDQSNDAHWIALKLHGVECNRDAIGARIEVYPSGGDSPLIRTLKAGNGFIGQSSKVVHVGLGQHETIDRVVIKWPGGQPETFSGLAVDSRYEITQGAGLAISLATDRPVLAIKPAVVSTKQRSSQVVVRSTSGLPMPDLIYHTFGGEERSTAEFKGKPLLLNLFASWCGPCAAELAEWAERADEIRNAGVTVLAVTVDSVASDSQSSVDAAASLLSRSGFPFETGVADDRMLQIIELIHDQLFVTPVTLPVPTSILLDEEGVIVAVFRGRASVDEITKFAKAGADDPFARRDASVPFEGRWFGNPRMARQARVIRAMTDAGLTEESLIYSERFHDVIARDPDGPIALYQLAAAFTDEAKLDRAERAYRLLVQVDETFPQAIYALGECVLKQGRRDEARELFQRATEVRPEEAPAYYKLGMYAREERDLDRAIQYLRMATDRAPTAGRAHSELGRLYQIAGDDAAAFRSLQQAIQNDSKSLLTRTRAVWLIATARDLRVKNPASALAIAQQTVSTLQTESALAFEALGAALAASYRFDEAVKAVEKAMPLARERGDMALVRRLEGELEKYSHGEVFLRDDWDD